MQIEKTPQEAPSLSRREFLATPALMLVSRKSFRSCMEPVPLPHREDEPEDVRKLSLEFAALEARAFKLIENNFNRFPVNEFGRLAAFEQILKSLAWLTTENERLPHPSAELRRRMQELVSKIEPERRKLKIKLSAAQEEADDSRIP